MANLSLKFAPNLRHIWTNLNDRERRMLSLLGFVFLVLVSVGIIYVGNQTLNDLEQDQVEIRKIVQTIEKNRQKLLGFKSEKRAARERYNKPAPALASFIATQARAVGLTIRDVVDQPEGSSGNYKKRSVRANLTNVELKSVLELAANIDNSSYPVAIQQMQIEHYKPGVKYNVQLSVVAFDRAAKKPNSKKESQP